MYRNSSVMIGFPSRLVLLVLIVHLMYIAVSPVAFPNAFFSMFLVSTQNVN